MTAWRKEKEARIKRAEKRTKNKLSATEERTEVEKGEEEARRSKRIKTPKDQTTMAEESKDKLVERLPRHMHQVDLTLL